MATQGEWRTVARRRQPSATTTTNSQPQPFKPFFTKPSYADMVRRPTSSSQRVSPTSSNSSSPKTPTSPAFYVSPHSPSKLRFPPSPRYVEWKGRCFHCCRMGHNAAHCRNPKRCGKCWGQGHIGSKCPQQLSPTAPPFMPANNQCRKREPSFDDLLQGPIVTKPMPDDRPQKTLVFVERDEEYYQELSKLEGAVVMYNPELEIDLTIEQVAKYAARSNLVKEDEVSIGVMNGSRYVIILPHGLAPEIFIKAIPLEIWEEGFSFYQWNPLDDAKLTMPYFKVLIDLVGIPLDLFREKEVIRAMSSIGMYLGTMAQPMEGDVALWTVVVATTSLSLVPKEIGYVVGGLEVPVEVIPRTWIHVPLYKPGELPQKKERYKPTLPVKPKPPVPVTSPPSSSSNDCFQDEGETFRISKGVLVDLCRGRELSDLPEAVRTVLQVPPVIEPQQVEVPLTVGDVTGHQTGAIPLTTAPLATLDLTNLEIVPFEQPLALTQDEVQDTYEAGQNRMTIDSLQEKGDTNMQNKSAGAHNQSGEVVQTPQLNKRVPGCHNFLEELSKNPPRILQRGKDKISDSGTCSKAKKEPTRTCTVYSPRAVRPSTLQKRKNREQAESSRAKTRTSRRNTKAQKQARIIAKSVGLVEVKVSYQHCSRLAEELGFQIPQVQQALQIDNEERARIVIEEVNTNGTTEPALQAQTAEQDPPLSSQMVNGLMQEDQGEHLTDFDPDSEDELDSDFE